MKFQDLTGQKFNRLEVIERAPNIGKETAWLCRCQCGNYCIVTGNHLKHGQKSCGCKKHEGTTSTHCMTGTKIYAVWNAMLQRCENPNSAAYSRYGGRGIKVCPRWHDFSNFYADVSKLEHFDEKGYSLDGDYCPENLSK